MSRYTVVVTPWGDPKVSRTLVLSGRHSLQALHSAIIDAFEFDDDHMHAFFLNGDAWDREFGYYSRPDVGQRGTRDARIGALGLVENKAFLYLFDFGDEHRFNVRVSEIAAELEGPLKPELTDSVGDAPDQYPFEDEDCDDSDADEGGGDDALPAPPPEWRDLVERLEACAASDLYEDEWDDEEDAEDGGAEDAEDGDAEDAEDGDAEDVSGPALVALSDQVAAANELLERVGAGDEVLDQVADWVVGGDLVDWLMGLPGEVEAEGETAAALALAERLSTFSFGELLEPAMAHWAAKLGYRDRARELIDSNLRKFPQDSRALLELGAAWKELHEVGKAEQCLRDALQFAGSDAEFRALIVEDLVGLLEEGGRLVEARQVVEREAHRQRRFSAELSRSSVSTVEYSRAKVGRNDPCPCGSDKKYKKCCGAAT